MSSSRKRRRKRSRRRRRTPVGICLVATLILYCCHRASGFQNFTEGEGSKETGNASAPAPSEGGMMNVSQVLAGGCEWYGKSRGA